MSTNIPAPFPLFVGLDGLPLNDGYVYIGLENQNPETAPAAVYWDSALTIPAAQPLRTRNGYFIRSGSAANVFIDGSFSITVRDMRSRLVFNSSSVADFASLVQSSAGSSYVGFIHAGTGAQAQTLQSRGRKVYYSSDYSTLQQALTAAAGNTLEVTQAYTLSAGVTVPAETTVIGKGFSITASTSGFDAVTISGDDVTIDGLYIIGANSGTASAIRGDGRLNPTVKNCRIKNWLYGIQLRGCQNSLVSGNRLWGGTYNASSSADIFIYGSSGAPSNRIIVSGNFCLSNTDNGISVDTNSGDRETVIANNVVVTCSNNGVSERSDGDNYRRNGIIVGYNGGSNSRATVIGNVVRNAPYAGIYVQGAALPAGDVTVTGNVVSRCGWGTTYPADASIRAGVLLSSGGQDVVSGNIIVDCTTAGIKYTPDSARNTTNGPSPVISGNTISRTTGIGIWLTNRPFGVLVSANKIKASSTESIYFQPANYPDDIGDIQIDGNSIETTSVSGAIIFDAVNSTVYNNKISNNKITGSNNTDTSVLNSGIYARGNVQIFGNTITKFYRGVIFDESGSTLDTSWTCDSNFIVDCAIGINGGQGTGTRVAQGNRFRSCTTRVSGCWEGAVITNRVRVSSNAAPTSGVWGQGDHVQHASPSVGQPKGWFCTVAGSPGTWVSEGNL